MANYRFLEAQAAVRAVPKKRIVCSQTHVWPPTQYYACSAKESLPSERGLRTFQQKATQSKVLMQKLYCLHVHFTGGQYLIAGGSVDGASYTVTEVVDLVEGDNSDAEVKGGVRIPYAFWARFCEEDLQIPLIKASMLS